MTKAFDYFLLGYVHYLSFNRAANAAARNAYAKAIAEDGTFHRARADLAYSMMHAWVFNWDQDVTLEDAQEVLQPALDAEPGDYYNLWIKAALHLYSKDIDVLAVKNAYETAEAAADKQAIPEDYQAFLVDRAEMLLLTGDAATAVEEIDKAIAATAAISVPEKWFYWVKSWAHYANDDWAGSISAIQDNIGHPRNAMRKTVICSLVAQGGQANISAAEIEADKFLKEENAQGITYPTLNKFLDLEKKIPFALQNQADEWRNRLEIAFKNLLP